MGPWRNVTPFAAVVIVTSAAETTLQGALTGGSYLINDWHMDTFDLKWPKTDATFYTDGWRCRIVWRQSGGMGGTIDNNQQCKKRVADSLSGAPYLLAALQARGHSNLATEIEDLAATTAAVLPAQNAVTPSVAVQSEQNPTPVKLQKKAKVAAPEKPQKPAAPYSSIMSWPNAVIEIDVSETVAWRFSAVTTISSMRRPASSAYAESATAPASTGSK